MQMCGPGTKFVYAEVGGTPVFQELSRPTARVLTLFHNGYCRKYASEHTSEDYINLPTDDKMAERPVSVVSIREFPGRIFSPKTNSDCRYS
jgi:hypothetical protein